MVRPLIVALAVATLAACGGENVTLHTDTVPPAKPPTVLEVVDALRGGGYVLFLRHAITDHSERDEPGFPLSDCSHQRNLTDEGRAQARMIGRALRRLRIPVGDVLSSEYCRTRETAELAFGRARVVDDLTGLAAHDEPDRARRVRTLRALLGTPPSRARNTVIVGHIKNLEAATQVAIEEGDIAVFEPLGGSRFRHLLSIPARVWPGLLRTAGGR